MKANKKIRNLSCEKSAYTQLIGGLVALLLMIIVAVMVYWETQGAIEAFGEVTETFTSDTEGNTFVVYGTREGGIGSNYTGELVKLDNSVDSITNVYVWNASGGDAAELCTITTHYTLNESRYIWIIGNSRSNFTQINVTYTSNMATGEDTTSDMAGTVFDLLPIIALAVVASIIIGVIIGFGGGKRGL